VIASSFLTIASPLFIVILFLFYSSIIGVLEQT
jgi:hypothetical protein